MASPEDNLEISLLSSVYKQFVEYTSNKNIIGAAPDLDKGIYHINKLIENKDSYYFLPNKPLHDIIEDYVSFIDNYSDKNIEIKDHKLIKFDDKIADKGS